MRDRRGNSVPSPRPDEQQSAGHLPPQKQHSLPPHIHPSQLPRSHSEAEEGPSYSQFEEYCAYYCSHQQFSEPVVVSNTTTAHYYTKEETEVIFPFKKKLTPYTMEKICLPRISEKYPRC
jgi:hypothetical protein